MAIPGNGLPALRNELSCPLSYELFENPYTEEEGTCCHTFEWTWIKTWLEENKTCPLTRKPLTRHQLVPNPSIQAACALLNPGRVAPLTQEDYDEINVAKETIKNRTPVSEKIHQYLQRKVIEYAEHSQEKSTQYC
jgi:hypothetical protein